MKKRKITILAISIIMILIGFMPQVNAEEKELDLIENYLVIVDPNLEDGSLDITYEIKWKVLDSDTEGPLNWVKIQAPNEHFSDMKPLTPNIKNIEKENEFVKITFDRPYKKNDEVTFKYSIHQEYMYTLKGKDCIYKFSPIYFKDIRIENLTIKWHKAEVKKVDTKIEEDNYYVWRKQNIAKGEKIQTEIEYKQKSFSNLSEKKQATKKSNFVLVIMVATIIGLCILIPRLIFSNDYYGHSGFYTTVYHSGGGRTHFLGGKFTKFKD